MTVTPTPPDGAPSSQGGGAQMPPGQQPTKSSTQANVERATAITEELIDRGAPWSARTSWTIVLTEGIVVAILGVLFLFKPFGGSSTGLQLVGLVLLGGALITAFQLWRHQVRPDLETLAAFRAGSGVTVGLVTVIATFFTAVTDQVTAALAVVVGVGFLVFGLAGIASNFVRRAPDAPLPLFGLIINAVLALAGLVLTLAGAAGASSVNGVFALLGILLIVLGLALAGYSYLLRQQEMTGVRR